MTGAALPARVPAQRALVAMLIALAAAGWAFTADRMAGMDDGPGTDPGTLGFFLVGWVVMMAAMMFPSTWPMALMYRRVAEARGTATGATALFVGGYLSAWTTFGLAAYAIVETVRALDVEALAWDRGGRPLTVAVLALAAAYQLTPLKDVCLRRCRTPFSLVLDGFRPGRGSALALGARHGAWCVACCWGLMAALFALGVMSVSWMVLVGALIASEKLLPWRRTAIALSALVLAALALGVAIAPDAIPGLAVPGEMAPMPMMP